MTDEQLESIFTYHPPTDEQVDRYNELRATALTLARLIQTDCPDTREKEQAFINLQQAVMWANASIAINEEVEE